ncbi:MAG: type II toxin-antitoxin system CcdA family antitoxin [Rhizobiales bacterium]|nr:type II toxin-antitoxin system CcdA family antitoxin [Hyphomicrobiales bacterium]
MSEVSNPANPTSAAVEKVRSEQARLWRAENEQAFREYNDDIRNFGVWSDGRRCW